MKTKTNIESMKEKYATPMAVRTLEIQNTSDLEYLTVKLGPFLLYW